MPTVSFSGLASGIDSDALIKATLDARRLAYKPLQATIDSNNSENKSLEEFNTKLLALNDTLKDFLTVSGSGLSRAGNSSNKDSLDVSVSSSAPVSTTSVTVKQLAKGATFSFADKFSSVTNPIAPSLSGVETMTVTVGTGANAKQVEVSVDSTTTLAGVVEQLNENSSGKLAATAINLGNAENPQYILVMSSTETGIETGSVNVSVGSGISGIFQTSTIDQAQDAIFTIAGIGEITRTSNKVAGVIPGVTLNLKSADNIPVQISVTDDREKTVERLKKVVGQFNEIITFSKEKSKVERDPNGKDGNINVFSELAKTRVDDRAVQAIKEALGDIVSPDGKSVRVLADLGLATQRDGTLKLDDQKLDAALAADSVGCSELLNRMGDKLGATNGIVTSYTKFQGMIDSAKNSNDQESEGLQNRIDRIEDTLAKQQQSLKLLFASLEQRISKLNSTGASLTSILGSSNNSKK